MRKTGSFKGENARNARGRGSNYADNAEGGGMQAQSPRRSSAMVDDRRSGGGSGAIPIPTQSMGGYGGRGSVMAGSAGGASGSYRKSGSQHMGQSGSYYGHPNYYDPYSGAADPYGLPPPAVPSGPMGTHAPFPAPEAGGMLESAPVGEYMSSAYQQQAALYAAAQQAGMVPCGYTPDGQIVFTNNAGGVFVMAPTTPAAALMPQEPAGPPSSGGTTPTSPQT